MSPTEMLTPSMLEVVLPMLGFSLVLNVLLVAALVFKAFYQLLLDQLHSYWIGLQLMVRGRRHV